jgi:hypothetical protein
MAQSILIFMSNRFQQRLTIAIFFVKSNAISAKSRNTTCNQAASTNAGSANKSGARSADMC